MARISGINQMGPQTLKFQVPLRSLWIWLSYRDIEGSRGFQRVPEGSRGFQRALIEQRGWPMAMKSGINQLGYRFLRVPEGSRAF
jgi:hypothetical protein